MIVWLDGAFIPAADAAIHIDDPGFLSGDGVFETALLHQGGFFRLRPHLHRFAASAAMLRLPLPSFEGLAGIDAVDAIARELVRRNSLRHARLRFTLTRGVSRPVLLVTARAPAPRPDREADGWRIITARTRRPSLSAMPGSLKALGRTHALLARIEATDAAVDDALLLTDDGCVSEGPAWNVFWRVDSTLFTPSLDAGVLPGITRAAIIELAAPAGLVVREGLFPRSDLDRADEIFATMTSTGVVSIRELDGRRIAELPAAAAVLRPAYRALLDRDSAADPVR
jgi:branched-chain amino acid aminotransferase